ncbi:Mo-dependent nitrogenase-like protein [Leptolyngbya sp. PCC 7375]|nr:Mo-dependent nitrogenase-like protein [Leptolyngbya sp. PCC 7375]
MAILTSHPQQPNPVLEQTSQRTSLLGTLRRWINQIQVTNSRTAHLICRVIPSHCPFERDISLFGYTIHIPALCRLNPVYEEIVDLRLRALTYLMDACGENISTYIR